MSTANPTLNLLQSWFGRNGALLSGMAAPVLVIAILALMVLPIPPWLLDGFFTLNIATALMVMGEDAGGTWAREHGLACIFFSREGTRLRVRVSPAFSERFGGTSIPSGPRYFLSG